ncbi:unnamed protein product [Lampetra planeri]
MPTQATSLPLHHNVTAAATVLPKNGTGQGHGSPNERTPGRSQRADAENELRFVTAASSSCLTLSGAAFQERPAPRLYASAAFARGPVVHNGHLARPGRLKVTESLATPELALRWRQSPMALKIPHSHGGSRVLLHPLPS